MTSIADGSATGADGTTVADAGAAVAVTNAVAKSETATAIPDTRRPQRGRREDMNAPGCWDAGPS